MAKRLLLQKRKDHFLPTIQVLVRSKEQKLLLCESARNTKTCIKNNILEPHVAAPLLGQLHRVLRQRDGGIHAGATPQAAGGGNADAGIARLTINGRTVAPY